MKFKLKIFANNEFEVFDLLQLGIVRDWLILVGDVLDLMQRGHDSLAKFEWIAGWLLFGFEKFEFSLAWGDVGVDFEFGFVFLEQIGLFGLVIVSFMSGLTAH